MATPSRPLKRLCLRGSPSAGGEGAKTTVATEAVSRPLDLLSYVEATTETSQGTESRNADYNPNRLRFMDLPPEIRNMIYHHICPMNNLVRLDMHEQTPLSLTSFSRRTPSSRRTKVVWKRFDWRCQRIGPNLLHLTNKQMSSEFTAVQYHNTVFVFWSTSEAATWLENIGERNRRRLRRIHIRPERISGSGAGPHGFFDRRARPYDNAMADLISESYLLEELQTGYVYRVRRGNDEDPELEGHDVSMAIARTVFSDFKPLFLARLRSQTLHEVSQLPARLSMMDVQSENPFVSLQAVQERLKVLLRQHLDQPRRIPFRWGEQQSR